MPPRLAKGIVEPRIDDKVISNLSSNRHRFPPNRREPGGPMGTKIAVIGGGSTYTPELVDGLARRIDRLPIDELVLLDLEPERLAVVGGLARRMLTRAEWPARPSWTATTAPSACATWPSRCSAWSPASSVWTQTGLPSSTSDSTTSAGSVQLGLTASIACRS